MTTLDRLGLTPSTYLTIQLEEPARGARKTSIYQVIAVRDGATLGWIRWFGRWRQYTFFPEGGTVFNHSCLSEIAACCQMLTRERPDDGRGTATSEASPE